MYAVEIFAEFITNASRRHDDYAIGVSRNALTDTIACIYAGIDKPIAISTLKAFEVWGPGDATVIARQASLIPPFAALVNAATAHALDYDDFDTAANSHPSAVIFPALFGMATTGDTTGYDILDAHIIGVEILQRLGESMNMEHYLRGWLTTLTLGSIAAAAACARLARFDQATTAVALSIASSMASGLTNQCGFTAKQLNAGLAAKNGVIAARLAESGITASSAVIDGPISMSKSMGNYDPEKFTAALAKLGNPWAIVEHGLFQKPYPSCGYTHRLIDAAIEIAERHSPKTKNIASITISVPSFYLDLLIYKEPRNTNEAMFSAQYSVAAALFQGGFDLTSLSEELMGSSELKRLCKCSKIVARSPINPQLVFDPNDPDVVEIKMRDGTIYRSEVALPTGAPNKPMSCTARRNKFDQCVQRHLTEEYSEILWKLLSNIECQPRISALLSAMA